MELVKSSTKCSGIKYVWKEGDQIIARAYGFFLSNNLHNQPFHFLEDVFVEPAGRGNDMTEQIIVPKLLADARAVGCYKAIATSRNNTTESRPHVHEIYRRCGYADWGIEFRINL